MTTDDGHTLYIKRYEPSDPRLGRHVIHDSRSLRFQVQAEDFSVLKSAMHPSRIPVLNQGNLGSCTGNAAVNVLATDPFWQTDPVRAVLSEANLDLNERYAVAVYSAATKLDPYPGAYLPTDTGSDGLSVAKVLQQQGKIAGYQHATSLAAALTALSKQACIVGTAWHGDMFNPGPDGRLRITGQVEGGHEYKLDEIDVENKRVWILNSWGVGWGVGGRAWLSWDDLGHLLADDGDCTVFVPVNQPAPTPAPPPPPAPPAPTPSVDLKAEFAKAWAASDAAMKYFSDLLK
jgi:hypothetical protein